MQKVSFLNYKALLNSLFVLLIATQKTYSFEIKSLFEHRNITFQKKYDQAWSALFTQKKSLTPDAFNKAFKTLIQKRNFFPNNKFMIGFSSSAYQFEGDINDECSWHNFALKKGLTLPGKACGFWTNYESMIKEMKEQAHINTFRLSIEWSRVEPRQGEYNFDALDHYRKIIQTLRSYEIEPIVVLNHYTVPTWFEELGDFEHEKNIFYFVDFAKRVYTDLHDLVIFWSTCNAPEGIAFKGRYTLTGAPGKEKSAHKTMLVMKNILEAHVQIYQAIKGNKQKGIEGLWQIIQKEYVKTAQEGRPYQFIPEPKIGIQKNIIQFDIAYDTIKQKMLASITHMINQKAVAMTDDPFYNFFTTGVFFAKSIAPWTNVRHENKSAPYSLDWIGVNYYSNKKRFLASDVLDTDPLLRTQNENYRYYPQGLYRAVQTIFENLCIPQGNRTGKVIPIIITENGIASINETQREAFNKEILIVLYKLLEDNYPIIGYTQWASHDNWEWGVPHGSKRYGNFFVDFNNILAPHTLKPGAHVLARFMQNLEQQ